MAKCFTRILSIKIPPKWDRQLAKIANQRMVPKSFVIREAIHNFLIIKLSNK